MPTLNRMSAVQAAGLVPAQIQLTQQQQQQLRVVLLLESPGGAAQHLTSQETMVATSTLLSC
jgi:hypothetical protein